VSPSEVSVRAVTSSWDVAASSPPPERCAKKRIVGCSMPTHIVGVVTERPLSMRSAFEPPPLTRHGSWSAMTSALPSPQPSSEPSKSPPGARK
jgi:hypothetical protein